jgi:hypothetical protein
MTAQQSSGGVGMEAMEVMRLIWPGAMAVQAVHVAARLGIADLVADGPKHGAELAAATHADTTSLERLLRALVGLGIFAQDRNGRYAQSPLSDALRSDHPHSIRRWAVMLGDGFIWKAVGELGTTVRTGNTAFEQVHGAPFFEYLAANPDAAAVFNAAMSSVPAAIDSTVRAIDFSRFDRIVDVGGGHGVLLIAILSANPRIRGVLHDLPSVIATAPAPSDRSVADRLKLAGGNFFEAVPSGADAYVLKGVVHDWNDESALAILRNCRRAIRDDGRLLLLETILDSSSDPARSMMDLLMMVLTGGRERTEAEFDSLLRAAGFALTAVVPTLGHSILECRPVESAGAMRPIS